MVLDGSARIHGGDSRSGTKGDCLFEVQMLDSGK